MFLTVRDVIFVLQVTNEPVFYIFFTYNIYIYMGPKIHKICHDTAVRTQRMEGTGGGLSRSRLIGFSKKD